MECPGKPGCAVADRFCWAAPEVATGSELKSDGLVSGDPDQDNEGHLSQGQTSSSGESTGLA